MTNALSVPASRSNAAAGTLDDTSWLRPDAHYWTRRRQPWVVLPDDVPVFEEAEG